MTDTAVSILLLLLGCLYGAISVNSHKLCTFEKENDCPLWEYTSSFRISSSIAGQWPNHGTKHLLDTRTGGKLIQAECQTSANPVPLIQTATWINSTSSSCTLSFDLLIPDRELLETIEVIMQRHGARDHLLWSATDETDNTILAGWRDHRIAIGHVTEPFRIVIESVCATNVKPVLASLLALDNLHFENCFPGLMKDNSCEPGKLACVPSGTCLDSEAVCDFIVDCPDRSDEDAVCDELPPGARCDFEEGLCKWMLFPDAMTTPGNSSWRRTSAGEVSNGRIPSDHTTGIASGYLMLLDMPKTRKHELITGGHLRSRVFPRISANEPRASPVCKINFYYVSAGLSTEGSVVLTVEQAIPNGARETIWQLRTRKQQTTSGAAVGWKRVTVPIPDFRSRYFLRFVGVHGLRGGYFAVDDISLSRDCFLQGLNDSVVTEERYPYEGEYHFEKELQVTTCGKLGPDGPTPRDCADNESARDVVVLEPNPQEHESVQGIQQWTVAVSGVYNITAIGATGGGVDANDPGQACFGTAVSGLFLLRAGEVISFIVGQRGQHACSDTNMPAAKNCQHQASGGGGGGTFVFKDLPSSAKAVASVLLLVAAGGSGHSSNTKEGSACPTSSPSEYSENGITLHTSPGKLRNLTGGFLSCTSENMDAPNKGGFGGGLASCGSQGGAGGSVWSLYRQSPDSGSIKSYPSSFVNQLFASSRSLWTHPGASPGMVLVTLQCNCSVACKLDRFTRDYYCPLENSVHLPKTPEKMVLHYILTTLLLVASVAGVFVCLYLGTRKGAKCIRRRADFFSCETESAGMEHSDIRLPNIGNHGSMAMEVNQLYELNGVRKLNDLRQISKKLIQLKQPLGEGAFGIVYQGTLKKKSELLPVAVKTLHDTCSAESEADFAAEALIVSKFHHPNVVQCFGVSFEAPPKYIVLELLAGGDVRTFLRRCRNTTDSVTVGMLELLEIAADIAKGCQYLEQHHFVHRDIAARNCLLTSTERNRVAKIADFGMSRDVVRSDYYRRHSSNLLPVRWMPPEALQEGIFSTKSDIWAFGIFLWEVFSLGCSPYAGLTNQEVIQYVVNGGRLSAPSRHCPVELSELMRHCWTRAPSERQRFSEIIQTVLGLMGVSSVVAAQIPTEADSPLPLMPNTDKSTGMSECLQIGSPQTTVRSSTTTDYTGSTERENLTLDFHSGTRLLLR